MDFVENKDSIIGFIMCSETHTMKKIEFIRTRAVCNVSTYLTVGWRSHSSGSVGLSKGPGGGERLVCNGDLDLKNAQASTDFQPRLSVKPVSKSLG